MQANLRNSFSPRARGPWGARQAGFTLLEILVAMSILLLAMGLTMGTFLATVKRAVHSEKTLKGTTELRYTSDMITEAVRSSAREVTLEDITTGRRLVVPPKDLGYAIVEETTFIDTLHNVKGSKSNMRMLHVSNATPAVVISSIFRNASRPAGNVTAIEVGSYFKDASALPTTNLTDLFSVGDSVTIPTTAYGPTFQRTINSISNNSGTKTITFTADLGYDVPNGTKIIASSGRRMLFTVETNGDLRYYPDRRQMSKFIVLARDVDPEPLSDPSNPSSARTTPFSISGRYLTINLQQLPRGSLAGRTVQGVQTTVLTRTDPLLP